ncbi:MAG: RHS repeat-associated core domain-containing protein, partial [Bacillota bacterium]|nr:RHS repeat-associated core domain-containing protein [Bacillota bacterium]
RSVNGFAGSATTQGLWYDAAGKLTRVQYNNGIGTDYHYNNRGLLSRIQSSVLDLNYTYDSVGNITGLNNETYTYDGLNRLLNTTQPAHNYTASYQYDNVGNRISQVENGIATNYAYNAVNELTSSTGISYTYDARGNLTGKVKGADIWSYTYDKANRLIEVKKNNVTLGTYTYDANGIRAKKVENGATTVYLALGHKNLYEKTGTVATKHVFAGPQRIAEVKDGVVTYFHNDHLGSPRAVTSSTGILIAAMATKPFGEPHTTNAPTDYLFTGKELDDTGLYYFAARYYDPSVGRFVTEDTWIGRLANPVSQNRYVYVVNNPLRYVDPSGNIPELALESGGGFGSGALIIAPIIRVVVGATPYVTDLLTNGPAYIEYAKQGADKAGRSSSRNGGDSASPDPNGDNWWNKFTDWLTRGGSGPAPTNVTEQVAVEQAMSNPAAGKVIKGVVLQDPRWPAAEGWVKMAQHVEGWFHRYEIHYVYNQLTGVYADFKIVFRGLME